MNIFINDCVIIIKSVAEHTNLINEVRHAYALFSKIYRNELLVATQPPAFTWRLHIELYMQECIQMIRVICNGTTLLFDGICPSNNCYDNDSLIRCPNCNNIILQHNISTTSLFFPSHKPRIVVHVKQRADTVTTVLLQLIECLELLRYCVCEGSDMNFNDLLTKVAIFKKDNRNTDNMRGKLRIDDEDVLDELQMNYFSSTTDGQFLCYHCNHKFS